MAGLESFGQVFRWLGFCLLMTVFVMPHIALAHSEDESYLYLNVNEGPMTGEIHVRVSDMAKAVPLDTDGDGTITDGEIETNKDAIADYLLPRVQLFDEAGSHTPELDGLRFFGRNERRHILLDISFPTLDPPPDVLGAEFKFLYDEINPAHRPMLLIRSNTRMRMAMNGTHISLEFEPGADRQTISLVPDPLLKRVSDTFVQGFLLILNKPMNLLLALTALAGCLRWYAVSEPGAKSTSGLAKNVALVSLLVGIGFATGLLIQEYFPFRVRIRHVDAYLAVSLGLAALANLLARRPLQRAAALLMAGVVSGVTMYGFGTVVGLNKGYIEIVYPGIALGIFAACLALAIVVLPLGFVLFRQSAALDNSIRIASLAFCVLAALFAFHRAFIL